MVRETIATALGALMAVSGPAVALAQESRPTNPIAQQDNAWFSSGQEALAARLAQKPIERRARNVILFVGDGMDMTTVTAARIYVGQKQGALGEEFELSFDRFPYTAFSKTYTTNAQTPDSAGTATAMVTGVKTRLGVISVSETVAYNDCAAAQANELVSIADLAEEAGMATGFVTSTRVTHATPAVLYAHSSNRNWEDDSLVPEDTPCPDIAAQLIDYQPGDGIDVVLGGGRGNFLPRAMTDPEYDDKTGRRKDGRDLVAEWKEAHPEGAYVWNTAGFEAVDFANTRKVLGLFEPSHLQYEADRTRDPAGEPSLADMTQAAITSLSGNENGYFLMVEAGRIDHAHHAVNAARAMEDTAVFAEAVARAVALTDEQETLIIVTADHGHQLVMQGYAQRGNPILGLLRTLNRGDGSPAQEPAKAADGKPYTVLAYGNGPSSPFAPAKGAEKGAPTTRRDLTDTDVTALDFRQPSLVPLGSETHGGQDVAIYARGPRAHLFSGTVEQNYIFHVMHHALGFGEQSDGE